MSEKHGITWMEYPTAQVFTSTHSLSFHFEIPQILVCLMKGVLYRKDLRNRVLKQIHNCSKF